MSKNKSAFKWIPYEYGKSMPENPKTCLDVKQYLVCCENGTISILNWYDGWNCIPDFDGTVFRKCEIKDVVAWTELPEHHTKK